MSVHFPFPTLLAVAGLPSVLRNLAILGATYRWNPTVFLLLTLVYFTQHNAFKVHPCATACQYFLLKLNDIALHGVLHFKIPYFVLF